MYFLTFVIHESSTDQIKAKLEELNDSLKVLVAKLSDTYNANKEQGAPPLYPGRHDYKELVATSDIFKNF